MLEMQNTVSHKELEKMKILLDNETTERKQRQEYNNNSFLQSEKRLTLIIQDMMSKLNHFEEKIQSLETTLHRGISSKNDSKYVNVEKKISEELYEFKENLKRLSIRVEE